VLQTTDRRTGDSITTNAQNVSSRSLKSTDLVFNTGYSLACRLLWLGRNLCNTVL